jgi:CRISPR-associated protein Cas5d
MQHRNSVEFKVTGRYALFTDPLTKIGGEKFSYQIPTYEALKGILCSVYWKPTIIWIIDKVRVMKPIRTQTRSAKPLKYSGKGVHDLSIYTYLADVEYQVQAHFVWNMNRKDMQQDRDENKHHNVAKRMIERGGRRDIFLGTRECQGYVESCEFGSGHSFYDDYPGEMSFDLMFHGFDYPDELGKDELRARFWYAKMEKGIVNFISPEECDVNLIRFVKSMTANPPKSIGLKERGLFEGCN